MIVSTGSTGLSIMRAESSSGTQATTSQEQIRITMDDKRRIFICIAGFHRKRSNRVIIAWLSFIFAKMSRKMCNFAA